METLLQYDKNIQPSYFKTLYQVLLQFYKSKAMTSNNFDIESFFFQQDIKDQQFIRTDDRDSAQIIFNHVQDSQNMQQSPHQHYHQGNFNYSNIQSNQSHQNHTPNKKLWVKSSIKKKNNNVIKKIGRIFYRNLKKHESNEGLRKMFDRLRSQMEIKNKKADMMDLFNTYHLNILFNGCEEQAGSYNLKLFYNILKKHFRKDVKNSCQLNEDNKVMYLNTIKLTQLRSCNKKLALRLKTESLDCFYEKVQQQGVVVEQQIVNEVKEDIQLPLPGTENSLIQLVDNMGNQQNDNYF